jgi:hypothetical protein
MNKRHKAKFIKELKHLHENNIVPQEHLIKIIKVVAIVFSSSKDFSTYHDLLEAVGICYKDKLLENWETLIHEATEYKPEDSMICNM